jgi:alkylated DNA nucleotide flippase Atl1
VSISQRADEKQSRRPGPTAEDFRGWELDPVLAGRSDWRMVLYVARLAREVTAFAGEREAARQVAYALTPADAYTVLDTLAVIASQGAKSVPMPQVAEVEHQRQKLEPKQVSTAACPRRAKRFIPQESVPVEVARGRSIAEVLRRYGIKLEQVKRSCRYVGCCPFHPDETPSLRVDDRKGVWYCFPCGIGGDAIAFVMRVRGLSFPEAVREVAA